MSGIYDAVQNPIPRSGFYATPDSLEDLMAYIGSMSGPERAVAMTVAMMALNLSYELVESKILSKEVFV
jgi:hypothetical protein